VRGISCFSRSELQKSSYATLAMITNSLHIPNSTSNLLRKHHDPGGTELLTVLYTLASVVCIVCLLVGGGGGGAAVSQCLLRSTMGRCPFITPVGIWFTVRDWKPR